MTRTSESGREPGPQEKAGNAALMAGYIFTEGESYIGCASDGTLVSLGVTFAPPLAYLADFPSPSDW